MARQELHAGSGNPPSRRRVTHSLAARVDDWIASVEHGLADPEADLLDLAQTESRRDAATAIGQAARHLDAEHGIVRSAEPPASGETDEPSHRACVPAAESLPADGAQRLG